MHTIIEEMLKNYNANNLSEQKNALKEVIQEIVLCGLSRAGFFNKAAFYGGTALRIFYGLDRFSENLDFSFIQKDIPFNLTAYFPVLEKEVRAFGLNVEISEKEKTQESNIRSAFLKGNTKEHFLQFYSDDKNISLIPKNEVIKIKFEVDTNPPNFATFERRYKLQPTPYEVCMYDKSSLFAGKLHAVLGRSWKNRIKGRDLYDYVFYMSKKIPFNLQHLHARLLQSGHISESANITLDDVKNMLYERFDSIDFVAAKKDVEPFIKNTSQLDIWSTDFFNQITMNLMDRVEG